MKHWFGWIAAFALFALAATPALAQGPFDPDRFEWAYYPSGWLDQAVLYGAHTIVTALALAALGALVVVFLPAQARQVSETARQFPLPSLGVGCLTLLVAVPLFVLLVVLIVTIPVALLLPFALAAAWVFGSIALGWLIGERVLEALRAGEQLRVPMVAVVIGMLALAIVNAVPVLGGLVGLGFGLVGLGAVILSRFGTQRYPMTVPPANN